MVVTLSESFNIALLNTYFYKTKKGALGRKGSYYFCI